MQSSSSLHITTLDCSNSSCLTTATVPFKNEELSLAHDIAKRLIDTLMPHTPAGGLAAPQIGISRSIFIFSYDRDPINLEVVLNPRIDSFNGTEKGWECCLSSLLSEKNWAAAKIPRYKNIEVTYMNLAGETIHKQMEGFAAKAFQHEYDHLQGLVNVYRSDAEVKKFNSKAELVEFMKQVKRNDEIRYIKPIAI